MTHIQINLDPLTCDSPAHVDRVVARLAVELPACMPACTFEISAKRHGQRMDPVWLPDADADDPDFDRLAGSAYQILETVRDETADVS